MSHLVVYKLCNMSEINGERDRSAVKEELLGARVGTAVAAGLTYGLCYLYKETDPGLVNSIAQITAYISLIASAGMAKSTYNLGMEYYGLPKEAKD